MDYSDRVNSKKGAGGVADRHEANIQTKQRIKELLTTEVLDLEKDPYLFRNHMGIIECRLCLTTHSNEASYISHLSGRKHSMNLERRRIISARSDANKAKTLGMSLNTVQKRTWQKIGKPIYQVTKLRQPETLRYGILLQAQYPRIKVKEPFFCFMSYYELSQKNRQECLQFLQHEKMDHEDEKLVDPAKWQYLVVSAEPYENITIVFPASFELDKADGDTKTESFWWHWDRDSGDFFLQFIFK